MAASGDKTPVTLTSADPNAERVAELRKLFPDVFADGRIDFEKLRAALGDSVAAGPERFTFSWAGRADAAHLLQTPSRATLVPKTKESVNWDTTRNLFIEGDNLEVLKLLYKAYAGKVKLIYIDPPYNTGNDFVYPDDFADPLAVYLKLTKQTDESGKLLTSNPETSGRYHSAWLSMMYPRLFLARQLLRDDGVILVSIDDHEVHHLRLLMSEVFGEENFVATLVWERSKKGDAKLIAQNHEYILVFARDKQVLIDTGRWRKKKEGVEEILAHYQTLRAKYGHDHGAVAEGMRKWYASLEADDPRRAQAHYRWSDDRGLYFADNFAGPDDGRKSRPRYDIFHPVTGKSCKKPSTGWRWDEETTRKALAQKPPRIHFGPDETTVPCRKSYLEDIDSEPFASVFYRDGRAATLELEKLIGPGLIEFPKSTDVLRELVALATADDSVVLDFFAGSCSTAQAVLELNREDGGNRRFVMVQLPEPTGNKQFPTISEIGKERIRRVITKLNKEPPNTLGGKGAGASAEDLGFRVFSLGESHFEQWGGVPDRDAAKYANQMEAFLDALKPDADPVAVLWELAVKEGYGLNSTIAKAKVGANTVYTVTDPEKDPPQSFRACLDEKLTPDIAKQLALTPTDLFICRDSALDDTLAANLALQCRLKTI